MSKTRRTFLRSAGVITAAAAGGLNVTSASPKDRRREQGTAAAEEQVQCVVTGKTASGKSTVVSHGALKPVTVGMLPGVEFYRIWGSDTMVALPSDGSPPPELEYFPPKNGFRFGMFSLPPATSTRAPAKKAPQTTPQQAPTQAQLQEAEEKLPGLLKFLEADHPGMHTTNSVDFDVVVFGEVVLELDDGTEMLLKAGDCVVQNGTRHAWHNRSRERCLIAFSLVGADRKPTA